MDDSMSAFIAGKLDGGGSNCCMPVMPAYGYGMPWGMGMMGGFGGGWGMGGMWEWFPMILIAGLLFGGSGWGLGGDRGGTPCATPADVRAAVDQQTLISKIDQQTYGLSDVFTGLNTNLNNNFRSLDNAVCTLGYQGAQHKSDLSAQLAQCCCNIERDIDNNTTQGVFNTNAIQRQISECCCELEKMDLNNKFAAQTNTCNTLQAIDKLGDRILGYLTNKEAQDLRDEKQALRLAASQARQNQQLVNELRPCPVPAYITCNPFAASYGFGYGNGYNGGCGSCCAA